MIRRRATIGSSLAASALVVVLGAGLAACGSDSASGSSTTAAASGDTDDAAVTSDSGAYEIVSDATVAAGIADTITTLTTLSAAPATATADAVKDVFEGWESYEGTVKQNDVDTYLALEDALGAFKKAAEAGDQSGLAKATADFSTAASTYLTSHPA